MQFGLRAGSQGTVDRNLDENRAEKWNASILSPLDDDEVPHAVFESCLNSLDACGFDASGVERPDSSYYVSISQCGHSLGAHMQSDAGGLRKCDGAKHTRARVVVYAVLAAWQPNRARAARS